MESPAAGATGSAVSAALLMCSFEFDDRTDALLPAARLWKLKRTI